MLAIAGIVTWCGYAVFVYGISQLNGQNYSFKDLTWPGAFTLGNPAPDPPGSGGAEGLGGISGNPTPCTKAQKRAGYTTGIDGNCNPPANPTPGGGPVGVNTCYNNKTGAAIYVKGKCPKGYTTSTRPGGTGVI
jgi:hypothetical protein